MRRGCRHLQPALELAAAQPYRTLAAGLWGGGSPASNSGMGGSSDAPECSTSYSGRGGDAEARATSWRSQLRGRRWRGSGLHSGAATAALPEPAPAPLRTGTTESFPPLPTAATAKEQHLSLKAQLLFDTCWKRFEAKYRDRYVCPREIVWLNGAPGAGKGTHLPFIMKSRGLSRGVGMSQLLDSSPEIKVMIDKGELVPDELVLDALLEATLNPDVNDGAGLVIDGFPRTAMQVDFVKGLFDRLMRCHLEHAGGPEEWRFPRPSFKVVILYVDEAESVRRQMKRAQLASLHNQRVMDAGTGDVWDVRTTDINEALCRRRYQVFKAHYHTILRLKQYFPFSLIDAMGTMEEARFQIMRELRYQSSLDLDEATYAAIRHLPLARDLVRVARQRLVFRLDSYCKRDPRLFGEVIAFIESDVYPALKQCSLAGHAEMKSRDRLFTDNSTAAAILIDVLSDRGFCVAHLVEEVLVPERFDPATGAVTTRTDAVHAFRITFDKENVRDLTSGAAPGTAKAGNGEDIAIGTTYVPAHMRRDEGPRMMEAAPPPAPGAVCVTAPAASPEMLQTKMRMQAKGQLNVQLQQQQQQGQKKNTEQQQEQGPNGLTSGEEVAFMTGWESMDAEISMGALKRQYGYETMNERED